MRRPRDGSIRLSLPDVHIGILDIWDSDLSEENRAIARGPVPNQDQIAPCNIKGNQLLICEAVDARPHLRLMFVPVPSRFFDLMLDSVLNGCKDLEGLVIGIGLMGLCPLNVFFRGCSKAISTTNSGCNALDLRTHGSYMMGSGGEQTGPLISAAYITVVLYVSQLLSKFTTVLFNILSFPFTIDRFLNHLV